MHWSCVFLALTHRHSFTGLQWCSSMFSCPPESSKLLLFIPVLSVALCRMAAHFVASATWPYFLSTLSYLQLCDGVLLHYLIIVSVHPTPTCSSVKWYYCVNWFCSLSIPPLPAALWIDTPALLDHTVCPPLPYLQLCEVVLLCFLTILSVHPSPTCSSVKWYSCVTWPYCLSTPPLPAALWSGTPVLLDHTFCPPFPYLQLGEVVHPC